jgi:hypothetical protein
MLGKNPQQHGIFLAAHHRKSDLDVSFRSNNDRSLSFVK